MSKHSAYLYYQAGQAVAAAHLGLTIRGVSSNPGERPTEIVMPRNDPKARMILWLTGLAAEKRGVGASDPLRRTRSRQRVRQLVESLMEEFSGTPSRRQAEARSVLNQSQDRANAICAGLFDAIEEVAEGLSEKSWLEGSAIVRIVGEAKARRRYEGNGDGELRSP